MFESSDQWIILELGPKADREDPDTIRASIRHVIRDAEVFIPASITHFGEEKVVSYLLEGYAFVKRRHPDPIYMKLENTKYVLTVLRHPISLSGGRLVKQMAVVTDAEIDRFRSQIRIEVDQGISVGDLVVITSGPYRQITARVEEEIPEHDAVQVYIKLRSKEAIITLPRAALRLVQKAPRSPLFILKLRVLGLHDWVRASRTLVGWKNEFPPVTLPYEKFLRMSRPVSLYARGLVRHRFITSYDKDLEITPVHQATAVYFKVARALPAFRSLRRLYSGVLAIEHPPLAFDEVKARQEKWEALCRFAKAKGLYTLLCLPYSPPPFTGIETRYLDWLWLRDVFDRLDTLHRSVDTLEQSLIEAARAQIRPVAESKKFMAQNLVIDGTQLAVRCALTPGLDVLKDSKGRPTGAITGFLSSLGSLKKRYPNASIYVTWDGSSQRRKKMFAGYKASRSQRSPMATFEIEQLRSVLSSLGIHQAFHLKEEADDVIATLVRGLLKGRKNLIVSTDRDLLQLVTATDHQLVPAVGVGKEKLYDVEAVLQEYGVSPEWVTSVRALTGDTSDDIPGPGGFGLKTASKLIQMYGSVQALLDSNLAGLTPTQYTKLRASEKQVKLNLELLRLVDDLHITLVGPNPDQTAVSQRLRELDIKVDPVLAVFIPTGPQVLHAS